MVAVRSLLSLLAISLFTVTAVRAVDAPSNQEQFQAQMQLFASSVANLMREMAELQNRPYDESPEAIEAARKQMHDFRMAVIDTQAAARKFSMEHNQGRLAKSLKSSDKLAAGTGWEIYPFVLKEKNSKHPFRLSGAEAYGPVVSAGLAILGGVGAGIYFGFHPFFHGTGPNNTEFGNAFGSVVLGGVGAGLAGFAASVPLRKGLQWYATQHFGHNYATESGMQVFFEQLKAEGIAVPNQNRNQWFQNVVENFSAEVFVQNSPQLVELQIGFLEAAIRNVAERFNDDLARKAVFEGLLQPLAEAKSSFWKRRFRPKIWTEETHLLAIRVRNRFAELCQKYNTESRGFSFEQDFQEKYNREIRQQAAMANAKTVFLAEDSITSLLLNKAAGSLLSQPVLDVFQAIDGKIRMKMDIELLEPAIPEISPVGEAILRAEVRLGKKAQPIPLEVKFKTGMVVGAKDVDFLKEETWIEPFEKALETALKEHPSVKALLCKTVLAPVEPAKADPAEADVEKQIQAEEEAADAAASPLLEHKKNGG